MSQLPEKLAEELKRILPDLRKNLQLELYKSIGYVPKQAFYSDSTVFGVFHSEAGKYLSLAGHSETEVEQFCLGNIHINDENRNKIHRIATLALVQLAMW
jgi:hypothetical protein